MATISVNTYLDGGTARTAGETWTMNGAVLTIRTDTRWHANAPAAMTGSIGATTISATLGGGVLIDARNVRWMAYDTGTGTVPAIGTTITQGGVSGYLLGVWSSLSSAPTAVGAAMPATGFLKFREVTGGSFAVGALTGIGANATEADRVGWIEVVQRQAVANTVPRLGFFRTRGDWFELGTTNGSAGQIIQIPTNGGGTGTRVPAVWIETAPGSGVYDKYPSIISASFIPANLGTDDRSKFVEAMTGGQIRIGNNGTSNVGFVPPSGCKVRIPNILGRQSASGTDATNQVPNATLGTRPDFTTTSAGVIDFEYFMNDWYHLFASPFSVRIVHCATMTTHNTSNEATATELEDYCVGVDIAAGGFSANTNVYGGTITNCQFDRLDAASNGHSAIWTNCVGYEIDGFTTGVIAYARSTGRCTPNICTDFTMNNVRCSNVSFNAITSTNVRLTNYTYVDRYVGTTNATTGLYAIYITNSSNGVVVDGISFGGYTDLHPYLGIANATTSLNCTIRNAGTPSSPIGGSTNAPAYIYADSGGNTNFRFQRLYLTATRTGIYTTANTSKNFLFEDCRGTVGSIATAGLDTISRGTRAASNSVTGQASVYGSHWFDMYISNTEGRIWLAFNEPTTSSASQYEAVSLGTGAGFTSGGQLVMPNLNDEVIWTQPYFTLGKTGFVNAAPVLTGTNTGNFSYEYDIDTGSGFSGTYKTLDSTNLSAETVDPTTGVRLKIRIVTTVADPANALTYISIRTTTTLADQQANLYPLDYATIRVNNILTGSRVRIYDTTNDLELYNAVVTGTSLTYSTPYTADFDVQIRVMLNNGVTAYRLYETTGSVTINGLTIAASQVQDTIYNTLGIDGSTITDIEYEDINQRINLDIDGTWSIHDIYAYEKALLFTEDGIRENGEIITATDTANFFIGDDFKILNRSISGIVITDGWIRDISTNNALDTLDLTGGTIYIAPEHVVAFETSGGGGGATPADIWSYSTRTLSSGGVSAIQSGLATSSEIAALNDITASEVVTAMQAVADDFKADVSGLAQTTDLAKLATKGDIAALD